MGTQAMEVPSQVVQRISIRWLPDVAFEDTTTVALNVGGYFVDLRVTIADQSIQWSQAGERIILKRDADSVTVRWTHIIDSLGLTEPDEAKIEKLPNGDELESGVTPAPHKDNIPTAFEEVWRDVTTKKTHTELSWILQSSDENTFIGKVGNIYVTNRKSATGFAARREDRADAEGNDTWTVTFQSENGTGLPSATQAVAAIDSPGQSWTNGQNVDIAGVNYIFRAVSAS